MSEGRRYYWLKLKEDFFKSKRIKKLRNMAGGDTYTIIYLKMPLLSLRTDGVLKWTGLEDDFAKELALDLDEKPEDVEVTLLYLLKTGLAETSDNVSFLLPWVLENTGSEGASAQRWRDWKSRQALDSNALLTDGKQITNGEKELERELELEKDKRDRSMTADAEVVLKKWNELGFNGIRNIVPGSERERLLKARIKENGLDAVIEAIEKVKNSDFLHGQNKNGWTIFFDWFIKPRNFMKVLEGNYDNRSDADARGSNNRSIEESAKKWNIHYG